MTGLKDKYMTDIYNEKIKLMNNICEYGAVISYSLIRDFIDITILGTTYNIAYRLNNDIKQHCLSKLKYNKEDLKFFNELYEYINGYRIKGYSGLNELHKYIDMLDRINTREIIG